MRSFTMPTSTTLNIRSAMAAALGDAFFSEALFDALPDVVFFIKDLEGRYVLVNRTLARRCGYRQKSGLLGKTAAEAFPSRFGAHYLQQDRRVLQHGEIIRDQLELHLYPERDPGWCITCKQPLRNRQGAVIGLAGISRDLHAPEHTHAAYQKLSDAARHIHEHYDQEIRLAELAQIADMSVSQIERYFHKIYHLTPRQMLIKARLDAASAMLAGELSITDIAAACGYHDHSAFTRQFKATVGMTPSEYRSLNLPPA